MIVMYVIDIVSVPNVGQVAFCSEKRQSVVEAGLNGGVSIFDTETASEATDVDKNTTVWFLLQESKSGRNVERNLNLLAAICPELKSHVLKLIGLILEVDEVFSEIEESLDALS